MKNVTTNPYVTLTYGLDLIEQINPELGANRHLPGITLEGFDNALEWAADLTVEEGGEDPRSDDGYGYLLTWLLPELISQLEEAPIASREAKGIDW